MTRELTLDGRAATTEEYVKRMEAASERILAAAFQRPNILAGGPAVGEDPEIALGSLVAVLCGAVAGGATTWEWLAGAIDHQKATLGVGKERT